MLTLSACATPAPEVAPPLVVTVVVTPADGSGAPLTAAVSGATPPVPPAPTSSYPPPVQSRLTCVYQPFERGFMVYLPDRKGIWVFYSPYSTAGPAAEVGKWLLYADTFVDGQPETDPNIIPPAGVIQPKRGFGKVWRTSEVVRNLVGWGLQYELPYDCVVTDYAIGAFDASGRFTAQSLFHTANDFNGKLVRADEATATWSRQ